MEYQPLEVPDVPPAMMRRVGALLGLASQAAQEAGNEALAPLGLSVKDFAVLTFLREAGRDSGPSLFSQQAIGERLRIDRTTMVAVIDDLDQPANVIKLTRQDARMQARAEKALDALMNDHYLAPLSDAERQTLAELLTRLVERSEQSR